MRLLGLLLVLLSLTLAAPAQAVASAELIRTQPKFYGRFEARFRFAPGDGVVGSFFLWKPGSEMTGAYWNELDFEKVGANCELRTNALYGAPGSNHSQTNAFAGNLCADYHTYGFEWTPTYISWQIDGTEVRRDTGATATAFAQNASAGMEVHFNVWPGDATFGGNFNPSILPVHQYVSWAQYSAYNNGNFSLEWREDFNAASLPSGWAVGNWASPKGKSTHSPADVNFVNGISILSVTNDNATGFTGTPPADGAAAGSGAGGAGGAGGRSAGGMSGSAAGGASGSAAGGASGSAAGGASGSATGGMDGGSSGAGTSAGGGGAEPAGGSLNTGGQGGGNAGTSAGGSGDAGAAAGTGQVGGAGAAAGGAPAAGSGAAQGEAPPDSAGCGCRLATTPRSSTALGALTLATVMALVARRRSRRLPRS